MSNGPARAAKGRDPHRLVGWQPRLTAQDGDDLGRRQSVAGRRRERPTSSTRLWTSIFLKMWAKWVLTVSEETNMRSAIWRLLRPSVASSQDPRLRRGERFPASGRAAAGAARAARPFERVLCAQFSALGARRRIGAVGQRVSQPAVDRGPVPVLRWDADGADLCPGALRGGKQPRRLDVAVEAAGNLGECVETRRYVGRVAALGAGVEVRERMLLGDRPVAARGGQATLGEAGGRREESIAEPLGGGLGVHCRGLGGVVAEQPLRLGEQAQRPRRAEGDAPLDERQHVPERVTRMLGPAQRQLGERDVVDEPRHDAPGAEGQRPLEARALVLESPRGLALPHVGKRHEVVGERLHDRFTDGLHRRAQMRDRLTRLREATVEARHPGDVQPAPGDLHRVALPHGQLGELRVGASRARMVALPHVGADGQPLGRAEGPVIARPAGERGRACELGSARAWIGELQRRAQLAARTRGGRVITGLLGQPQRLRRVRIRGREVARPNGQEGPPVEHPRAQPGLAIAARLAAHANGSARPRRSDHAPPTTDTAQRRTAAPAFTSVRSACSIAVVRLAASGSSTRQPLALSAGLELGTRLLRQAQERVAMARTQRRLLAGLGQPFARELAHRLLQAVAHHGALLGGEHERLVDQGREQVEQSVALDGVEGADLLRGLVREPAREHRRAGAATPARRATGVRDSTARTRAASAGAVWRSAVRR